MSEQAVIIRFKYTSSDLNALYELEDRLTEAIDETGEGECEGHDITPDLTEATIYLYGPDTEFLFVVAQQVIEQAACVRDAIATIRLGPPEEGVPERQARIKWPACDNQRTPNTTTEDSESRQNLPKNDER